MPDPNALTPDDYRALHGMLVADDPAMREPRSFGLGDPC